MSRGAFSVRAAAGIVAALVVAGCAETPPAPTSAPGPALSDAQAAEVQARYDQGNNAVNEAYDTAGVGRIEAPPLQTASRAWLRIKQRQNQRIPSTLHTEGRYLISSGSGYPRWFVSITKSVRGGVASPRAAYTVFVQKDASSPWLATYLVSPSEPPPAVDTNDAGAITAVTDPKPLALAPTNLGAAIFEHYTTEATGDQFARTAALDDQLGAGYRVGKELYDTRGWVWTRTLDKAPQQAFAVRTKDGGALAFTASLVVDAIEPGDRGGKVTLDRGSSEAALVGSPDGVATERLVIERLQTFLTYIPTKASGQQVRVLAYNDTPVRIRWGRAAP